MSDGHVSYPDFYAAVATLAPVLMLATIAIRRWSGGGLAEHPHAPTRRFLGAVFWTGTILGLLTFATATAVLSDLPRTDWSGSTWVRLTLLIALGVQFLLAGTSIQAEHIDLGDSNGDSKAAPATGRRRRPVRGRPRTSRRVHRVAGARRRLRTPRGRVGRILDAWTTWTRGRSKKPQVRG